MVRKRRKKRRFLRYLLVLILLVGVGWGVSVWLRVFDRADGYERDPSLMDTPGITNVLIVGLDAAGERGRADSIIVMSINENTTDTALVSIPRDSRVEIPGRGMDKINHAMAYEGMDLMRPTVEHLLDVPIHHYVYTNFSGFQSIVDAVNGVTLDVERSIRVRDPDTREWIELQPGVQRLNGREALSYVRFRMDGEGDFGRMRRQQQFLTALADEVSRPVNVVRMPQLMESVAEHVRTDMPLPQLLQFGMRVGRLDLDAVTTVQLRGAPTTIDGVSYVILDEQFMVETVRDYLRWEPRESAEII